MTIKPNQLVSPPITHHWPDPICLEGKRSANSQVLKSLLGFWILSKYRVVRSHLALPFARPRWSSSSACRRWLGVPHTPQHWSRCGWSCCSSRRGTGRLRLSSSPAGQCIAQLWGSNLEQPGCAVLIDKLWQLPGKQWKRGQISNFSCFNVSCDSLVFPLWKGIAASSTTWVQVAVEGMEQVDGREEAEEVEARHWPSNTKGGGGGRAAVPSPWLPLKQALRTLSIFSAPFIFGKNCQIWGRSPVFCRAFSGDGRTPNMQSL